MNISSVADVEKIVRDVTAIMSFEDMDLTEQDKNNMRRVLNGEVTGDDMVAEIVKNHKFTKGAVHE